MNENSVWWDATLAGDLARSEDLRGAVLSAGFAITSPDAHVGDDVTLLLVDEADERALRAVAQVRGQGSDRVLVVVDRPCPDDGWRLLASGASDVLPHDGSCGRQVCDRLRRWAQVDALLDSPTVRDGLVGSSTAWRDALRQLVETARYTTSSLLISGESGTGKELAARLVHLLAPSASAGRLIVVDCTTIVPTLSGSEFFGHEKGAFTGATAIREGAFAAADGGTLFLDEVGELPLPLQAELLRVVQERSYKRVGGNEWRRTSFRLLCATHRDLEQDVREGRFRADFYYRIAAALVHLPPLRERRGDIMALFASFVRELTDTDLAVSDDVRHLLCGRDYPGNVRELKQLTVRIVGRHVGPGPITVGDVPEEERPARPPFGPAAPAPGPAAPGTTGLGPAVPAASAPTARLVEVTTGAEGTGTRTGGTSGPGSPGTAPEVGVHHEVGAPRRPAADPTPTPESPAPSTWAPEHFDDLVAQALAAQVRYEELHAALTESAHRVALARAHGNQRRAAEVLGLSPRALQKHRQRHPLTAPSSGTG